MSNISDEKNVSKFYHSIEPTDESTQPPSGIDAAIIVAAEQAGKNEKKKRHYQYFVPLSAAASVLIVITLAMQLTVFSDQEPVVRNQTVQKQPMFMLQRSKPVAIEEMLRLMNAHLDKGELSQAQLLYKRIKQRYPEYQINETTLNKLK